LRVLHAGGVQVALVVTHRDHPGETLWFSRVADTAADLGLPVVYAEDLDPQALAAQVASAAPEVIFSFYFRSMLPSSILECARLGAFNMHGSLLPRFRGRAPTNWAVLKGATETGATLHRMVARPDAGTIVDQCAVPILPDDSARQVFDKVCVAAEVVLWRSLPAIAGGCAPEHANDLSQGSYFGGRKPEDGRIDWTRSAAEVYNLIRAVAPPYPGAFTDCAGRRLVVAEARRRIAPLSRPAAAAGLAVDDGRMVGVCGDGGLIDIRVLLEGGRSVDAATLAAWLNLSGPPP
jgi:methionyl-tRNA formyltransferase